MSRKTRFAVVLLASLAAVFVWERNALTNLRYENGRLQADKEEADHLAAENQELLTHRAALKAVLSAEETLELLRLRNEVRQLRAQKPEVEKLRVENECLKARKFTPRKLPEVEGLVPREKWTHVGFATPEAAVQSFFWAIATGNVEQFFECLEPRTARSYQRAIQQDPERFRQEMERMNLLRTASGFAIAARTDHWEGKQFTLQIVADRAVISLGVLRVGNEWKVDHFTSPEKP